jgi:hypothetical protein
MGCSWSAYHQLSIRLGTFMLHINMSGSDVIVVGFSSSISGTCLLFIAKAVILLSVVSL